MVERTFFRVQSLCPHYIRFMMINETKNFYVAHRWHKIRATKKALTVVSVRA